MTINSVSGLHDYHKQEAFFYQNFLVSAHSEIVYLLTRPRVNNFVEFSNHERQPNDGGSCVFLTDDLNASVLLVGRQNN